MRNTPTTLGQLVTATQTAKTPDVMATPYLEKYAGMFSVLQGKAGLKVAREWLLGIAILELMQEFEA
tara:strand:- start:471 stop:671 length:201 start_codon:yes stop_codon:yes gene_type:complete